MKIVKKKSEEIMHKTPKLLSVGLPSMLAEREFISVGHPLYVGFSKDRQGKSSQIPLRFFSDSHFPHILVWILWLCDGCRGSRNMLVGCLLFSPVITFKHESNFIRMFRLPYYVCIQNARQ